MTSINGQKQKLSYLIKMFEGETDSRRERNTMDNLYRLTTLENDIESQSIYCDIEVLREVDTGI